MHGSPQDPLTGTPVRREWNYVKQHPNQAAPPGMAAVRHGAVCKVLWFSVLEGCIPAPSQATLQHSFSLLYLQSLRILTEWSRFVASPFLSLGGNFWQMSHPIWSLPPANRRQWEAVKVSSWTYFDKLQMERSHATSHYHKNMLFFTLS